jgi:predicted TIM-barrel fold metal-dependent hydrolase
MWIDQQIAGYRQQKAALDWLDAHCWIGVGPAGLLRPVATFQQTRQLLDRYGIRRAILSHAAARDYDPHVGNQLLLEAIRDERQFLGAAVLIPGDGEVPELRRRLAALMAGKIRLVRIFPRSHNFLLSEWCAGPWLEVLEELHMPLAVWHTETAWEDVAAVCQAHPRLPVIVEGPNRKLLYHNRVYYRLLERFANFHLEIHNLVGYLGLDDVVRRFGSQRLIFGTYFPQQDPNVPMALVTQGELSMTDRKNIAFRNMERLIEAVSNGP